MRSDPKQLRIVIAAFLIGFITMAYEITLGRVFSMYFGSSTITWSGVIAAFILTIGIGYGLGGILSRNRFIHANLLGLSLIGIVIMPFLLETLILAVAAPWWFEFFLGLALASAPLIMVAATVPSLIEQRRGTKADASSVVLSSDTVGSVLGIIASGVVLLPLIGVWKSVGVLAIFAVALSIITRARWWFIPIAIAGLLMYANAPDVIPSPFADIEVEYGNGIVQLSFGPSSPQSAMFLARPHIPVYEYSRFIDELSREYVEDADTILMLGAGGCTHVPMLLHTYPSASITVVDNNPRVFEVCEEHFGVVQREQVDFVVDDARLFVQSAGVYDLVVLDTFGSLCTVPEHLITYEFHNDLGRIVAQDGLIIMNAIFGSDESERVIEANLAASFELIDEKSTGRRPGNHVYVLAPGGNDEPMITDDHNPYSLMLSRECLG